MEFRLHTFCDKAVALHVLLLEPSPNFLLKKNMGHIQVVNRMVSCLTGPFSLESTLGCFFLISIRLFDDDCI